MVIMFALLFGAPSYSNEVPTESITMSSLILGPAKEVKLPIVKKPEPYPSDPEELVRFFARKNNIDEDLVACLADKESTFNKNPISPSGKYHGIFQFDMRTWGEQPESNGDNRLDIVLNTQAATRLMSEGKWSKWPMSYDLCTGKATTASNLTIKTGFDAGYCTAYVASKFPVTWRGDAIDWANNAKAQGYTVDLIPTTGAILQTNENSRGSTLGHVAYIESVSGGFIHITEQNYKGRGIISPRSIPVDSPLVRAVIHRL